MSTTKVTNKLKGPPGRVIITSPGFLFHVNPLVGVPLWTGSFSKSVLALFLEKESNASLKGVDPWTGYPLVAQIV